MIHCENTEDAYCSSSALASMMKVAKISIAEVNNYTIQWYILRTIAAHTDTDYIKFNP